MSPSNSSWRTDTRCGSSMPSSGIFRRDPNGRKALCLANTQLSAFSRPKTLTPDDSSFATSCGRASHLIRSTRREFGIGWKRWSANAARSVTIGQKISSKNSRLPLHVFARREKTPLSTSRTCPIRNFNRRLKTMTSTLKMIPILMTKTNQPANPPATATNLPNA